MLFTLLTLCQPYSGIRHIADKGDYIIQGVRPMLQKHLSAIPTDYLHHPLWRQLTLVFFRCTKLKPQERPDTAAVLKDLETLSHRQPLHETEDETAFLNSTLRENDSMYKPKTSDILQMKLRELKLQQKHIGKQIQLLEEELRDSGVDAPEA